MKGEEDKIQISCVKWFDLQYKRFSPLLYCNYNNPRNAIQGAKLKKMGMRKGIPDLFLAIPTLIYNGLYIEMKTAKGVLSKEQKEYSVILKEAGYHWAICRSTEEFIKEVRMYLDDKI
jgi:hypothetical protein